MISGFGWSAFIILAGYIVLFLWRSAVAETAAGRPVWLFQQAAGRDRWAGFGFRAAFVLAFLGPLLWLAWPALHKADPFWSEGELPVFDLIGMLVAGSGALLAYAAQVAMGRSWRVGVAQGATGKLVSNGLFRFSRNPTFVGQFALLVGISFAIPAIPTFLAVLLYIWSARTQVRSEEEVLRYSLGAEYDRYAASVPRWIGLPREEEAMNALRITGLIGITVLADQASKAAALLLLPVGESVAVLPGFFNLVLGFNEGASFGIMSGIMTGKPLLMAALTGVLALAFTIMAFRARHRLERIGLALIAGGALGNIIDRLRQGAVTDFLDFHWRDWHWPTFNGADIAITLGAMCILSASLPFFREERVLDQT